MLKTGIWTLVCVVQSFSVSATAEDFSAYLASFRNGRWDQGLFEYIEDPAASSLITLVPEPLLGLGSVNQEQLIAWCDRQLENNQLTKSQFRRLSSRAIPKCDASQINLLYDHLQQYAQSEDTSPLLRLPVVCVLCASGDSEFIEWLQAIRLHLSLTSDFITSNELPILSQVLISDPATSLLERHIRLVEALVVDKNVTNEFAMLRSNPQNVLPFALQRGSVSDGKKVTLELETVNPMYRYESTVSVSTYDRFESMRSSEVVTFARWKLDEVFKRLRSEIRRGCEADPAFFTRHSSDIDLLMSRMLQVDSKNVFINSISWYHEVLRATGNEKDSLVNETLLSTLYVVGDDSIDVVFGNTAKDYFSIFVRAKVAAKKWEEHLLAEASTPQKKND